MNKLICIVMCTLPLLGQEHKESHIHSVRYNDFTISISGLPNDFEMTSPSRPSNPAPDRTPTPERSPTPPRVHHHHRRCNTKVKVALISAGTTIGVTALIILLKYFH